MIDVLTTATLRPTILRQTYTAAFAKLQSLHGLVDRLCLTIDPVGETDARVGDVIEVAAEFFPNLAARTPQTPSLPKAWCWLFDQAENDYALWLEDDWEFLVDIDLADVLNILTQHPTLALLRFSRFEAGATSCRQWTKIFPWTGEYYACPPELNGIVGFSGNPSIIRGAFLREASAWIVPWGCPEKQVKYPIHAYYGNQEPITRRIQEEAMRDVLSRWSFGVYAKPGWPRVVRDIGEQWRRAHKINKLHGRECW